jgi:adenylate cyclase
MAQIVIEQPGLAPQTLPLEATTTSFGRADDCDVVLVTEEVSRHHAKIVRDARGTVLVDEKSLNGTYVNRQRIVERVLSNGDEIWLGSKCRMQFHCEADTELIGESEHDSQLKENIDKIRAEMDRVGNNMTMMGAQTPRPGTLETPPPKASPDEIKRMGQAYRRMSGLHKASQVMASNFDLDERLAQVLDIVMEVMSAERGFVILREEETNFLAVRVAREMGQELSKSSPSMGIAGRAALTGEPVLMESASTDEEFGMRDSIVMSKIMSAMCVPLKCDTRILGSIYVDTRNAAVSFTEEDLELFASMAAQSALAIDNVQLHEQVVEAEKRRQSFSRFLPKAIVDRILDDGTALELGGQKTLVSTMFCDIRGSTKLGEQLTPQELISLLNEHFTAMTEILFEYEGTLDKYIGDEIMAIFGAPIAQEDHDIRAVSAALALQACNEKLNVQREESGHPQVHVGIGIDSGEVIAGYIGSPMRMDYTVVGDRVNTAKRFCDLAAGGKVVVGEETWNSIRDKVNSRPLGTVTLKGKEQPVHAHEIISLRE